jgi:hypothetical protein
MVLAAVDAGVAERAGTAEVVTAFLSGALGAPGRPRE